MERLKFVSLDQLLEMQENGDKFVLAGAQSAEGYAEGHLPGAILLQKDKVEEDAKAKLPDKNAVVVVYCGGYTCHSSTKAARKLMEMGYKHVFDFKAGKKGWVAAGLELEK